MNEEEIARGLAALRALLDESGLDWLEPQPALAAEDGIAEPRPPRVQLLDLLQELRIILVEAPMLEERLLAETGARRVVFKPDPVDDSGGLVSSDNVTFLDRGDADRRMEVARQAGDLIDRLSSLASG